MHKVTAAAIAVVACQIFIRFICFNSLVFVNPFLIRNDSEPRDNQSVLNAGKDIAIEQLRKDRVGLLKDVASYSREVGNSKRNCVNSPRQGTLNTAICSMLCRVKESHNGRKRRS